jgi:hypothetical protein
MDNKYTIFDIFLWSGAGFFAGEIGARVVSNIANGNRGPPDHIAKIALAYGMIGLIAGSIRGYTGKSIVELIVRG